MVLSCCAPFCTNRATKEAKEKRICFYRLPKDPIKRGLWLRAINRKDYNPGPNTYICSEHFVGGEWRTSSARTASRVQAFVIFKLYAQSSVNP